MKLFVAYGDDLRNPQIVLVANRPEQVNFARLRRTVHAICWLADNKKPPPTYQLLVAAPDEDDAKARAIDALHRRPLRPTASDEIQGIGHHMMTAYATRPFVLRL